MRRWAQGEEGFALVAAIVMVTVMVGLGLSITFLADGQQKAAAGEQAREGAFNLAEAALNAQIGQISRIWPEAKTKYEARCTALTTSATNGCPSGGSLAASYPASEHCAAGATEPWGSPLSNSWTTYVRDDVGESPIFNSATENTSPAAVPYDANGNGKLWVRATGVYQCKVVTLVTQVSRQFVAVNFPRSTATGNWFRITNEGKKTIVNTLGEATSAGPINMRCSGVTAEHCEEWSQAKEQVAPDTTGAGPTPSPTVNENELAALRATAESAGTFHSAALGNCPSTTAELTGLPTYIENCGELKLTDGVANAPPPGYPGFLVLANGTLELRGNAEFYGVIYDRNMQETAGAAVILGGTAQVFGGIDVDGNGGIEFGSSKANLIYNPLAISLVKAYAGATPTRNTFRILPVNQ